MKIGFVGLGKLGLPCALAIEHYGGHELYGTDSNAKVLDSIRQRHIPYREVGAEELLKKSDLRIVSTREIVRHCDIVFVAVQTPHDPRFEGVTTLPNERADFDYSFLMTALKEVSNAAEEEDREVLVVIISTVLPGSVRAKVKPLLSPRVRFCYNPFFIAMGTTIEDFLNPEFVLVGSEDDMAIATLSAFYATLHEAPIIRMSIESAELTKVAYNTFIGMKIVFANALMEVSQAVGANVDEVTDALGRANRRLISPKYLSAGMGDGGGCHPRDNIAMSWLAREIGLSYDLFEALMTARERQTAWLATQAVKLSVEADLPIVILGKAFKPGTNLTVGSPAVLLRNLLSAASDEVVHQYDPFVDAGVEPPAMRAVYVIATAHEVFTAFPFPLGSYVLDPWGITEDRSGVSVRRIGRSAPTLLDSER